MTSYQGGCACGAVRYESRAEPLESIHRYCRQCQRVTGAGHASQLALPANPVSFVGKIKFYKLTADSGNVARSGFGPVCGSPILKKSSGYPDMIFIHAATLDDPVRFNPRVAVWHDGKQPWDYVDPGLA